MKEKTKETDKKKILEQTRRLRDAMVWLVRGFSLEDPRKNYPGFYLSPQQCYVLSVIKDEGNLSPGEISKRLRIEKSHLTKIINILIGLGAIERGEDPIDRRKVVLLLTKKGEKIFHELDLVSIDSYLKFMKLIPENQRDNVIKATEIMLNAYNEMRAKAESGK
ncbi:MAG TPA: MarR family transcriptional regulator [Firmicutes bacterium]|mgnify:CR=1 FL=1|nr:MarR family transcriptional regulator [Bacillota bacterium]